jgi:hypothetical protein
MLSTKSKECILIELHRVTNIATEEPFVGTSREPKPLPKSSFNVSPSTSNSEKQHCRLQRGNTKRKWLTHQQIEFDPIDATKIQNNGQLYIKSENLLHSLYCN